LDWLAAEFMEPTTSPSPPSGGEGRVRGWSMKHLHRLLVTSSAYRMASTPDPDNLARDPDNRYLWRMNARRMEGEVVRDSLLAVDRSKEVGRAGDEAFVRAAFVRVLGRPPAARESALCRKFLAEQSALLAEPKKLTRFGPGPVNPVPPSAEPRRRARENLVH